MSKLLREQLVAALTACPHCGSHYGVWIERYTIDRIPTEEYRRLVRCRSCLGAVDSDRENYKLRRGQVVKIRIPWPR